MSWPHLSHRLMPNGRSRCGKPNVFFADPATCQVCLLPPNKYAPKTHRAAPDGGSVCGRARGNKNIVDTWDGVDCRGCFRVRDKPRKPPKRAYVRRIEPRAKTYAARDPWPYRFEPDHDEQRPLTRADCEPQRNPSDRNHCRPCIWVSCKHHLYLAVKATGAVRINWPDVAVADLEESCALDVAVQGGVLLATVGRLLNLTRERARQIEVRALVKLKLAMKEAA